MNDTFIQPLENLFLRSKNHIAGNEYHYLCCVVVPCSINPMAPSSGGGHLGSQRLLWGRGGGVGGGGGDGGRTVERPHSVGDWDVGEVTSTLRYTGGTAWWQLVQPGRE